MKQIGIPNLANFVILFSSMLVAIQFRQELAVGKRLGQEYVSFLPPLFVLLVAVSLFAYFLAFSAEKHPLLRQWLTRQRQFRLLFLQIGLTLACSLFLLHDISVLQSIYFGVFSTVLGISTIVLPGRLREGSYVRVDLQQDIKDLMQHNSLIAVWLRYEIKTRYSEMLLGILWIVVMPLAQAIVMAFAFTQFLGAQSVSGVSFVSFLLSGQVMFMLFNKIITQSQNTLLSKMSIIKQVYFPREIIIILIVGETMVDFGFMFVVMLFINAVLGILPNIYFLLLPIPILLMLILATGLAFMVSWISLMIRDFQQLVGIIMQLLFYVTVLYRDQRVDPNLRYFVLFNPVSAIVETFRDIVLYAQMPNLSHLFFATVVSFAVLYVGYTYYKVNEDRFVDFI